MKEREAIQPSWSMVDGDLFQALLQIKLSYTQLMQNSCLEPWAHEMWDSTCSVIRPWQPNGPKYEWSAQHQHCVLKRKRKMDFGYRWLPGATTWLQSPEYDSAAVSGVSSCQSHGSWEPWGKRAETQQRTSRGSPAPRAPLLWLSWGERGTPGTGTEPLGLSMHSNMEVCLSAFQKIMKVSARPATSGSLHAWLSWSQGRRRRRRRKGSSCPIFPLKASQDWLRHNNSIDSGK